MTEMTWFGNAILTLFFVSACSSIENFDACQTVARPEVMNLAIVKLNAESVEVLRVSDNEFCVNSEYANFAWEAVRDAVTTLYPVGRIEIAGELSEIMISALKEEEIEFEIIEDDVKLIIHVKKEHIERANFVIRKTMKEVLEKGPVGKRGPGKAGKGVSTHLKAEKGSVPI